MSKLPAPAFATGIPEAIEQDEELVEDGRVRAYPHERGQWTTHLYLPMPADVIGDMMMDVASDDMHAIEEPHVSLSRGHFVLRYHQIQPFIASLTQRLKTIVAFHLCLDEVRVFENDDKTRAFICLCDSKQATGSLPQLLQVVKETFAEFSCASPINQVVYAEEFVVHSSIFWYLPKADINAQSIVSELQSELKDEPAILHVTEVIAKIGNQVHRFELRKR